MSGAVTIPQGALCERERISHSLLTSLFRDGEVDSAVIGGRFRHVIEQSWRDYVERKRLGLERDPAEKAAAAAAYRASVPPDRTLAASRAFAGKKIKRPQDVGNRRPVRRSPREPELTAPISAATRRRD
jgi:hypothetical protein